jgi:hypothetical protein
MNDMVHDTIDPHLNEMNFPWMLWDVGTRNGAALRTIAFSKESLTNIAIEVKEMALKVPLKGHHYNIRLYPNPQSSI